MARYDMTQQDPVDKAGVSRMTVAFLEKGTYNPLLKLAYRTAKI